MKTKDISNEPGGVCACVCVCVCVCVRLLKDGQSGRREDCVCNMFLL